MKQDALRKAAAQLRKEAEKIERRKLANTARVTAAMLGLQHFKRILDLPLGGDP
jgi:hypothetical protein